MPESPKEGQNFDAQLAVENIAAGTEKQPDVNVQDDYEASKAFSTSEIDQTSEGSGAAEAATAPKQKLPEPEATTLVSEPTSDPEQYREMAKDVNPRL
ncbi:hypothetical protein H6G00_08555 [Leptolyngbya sp. FACHB-541]|uniref:hypothetical protein n=1 Tax=Leptolyngbya sp. FACHB-541 TaxID=2692810 RepID=UPI00168406D3|nr:hypothetical protein [Leptolyngbya sp. FACHB-541]MBD1996667.1 hypothetical protein [Leptolyngbya sp. FACHB-541]